MTPPILGIFASAVTGGVSTTSFESIATVTVGSGGASSISFTSIPSTYAHLQIRGIARDNQTADTDDAIYFYINGDTNANYSRHSLLGDGSTAAGYSTVSTSIMAMGASATSNAAQANTFAPNVIDILDYANTNKYKTFRSLRGLETNGTNGVICLSSGMWLSTSAITSIELKSVGGSYNFVQYTHFALYGIKAA